MLSFFIFCLFLYALWLPLANFGPLLTGQCHSTDVNHCVYSSFELKVRGPPNEVGFLHLAERLVRLETGTFLLICNALIHWATLPKLGFSR